MEWDPQAAVTPLGQLPFLIAFLKVGDRFEPWVEDCPLRWSSPNALQKRDVLGTVLLSILAGYQRDAHITALRSDGINPSLLGMGKVVRQDAVRRGLKQVDEALGRGGCNSIFSASMRRCSASRGCWRWTPRSSRYTLTKRVRRTPLADV